MSVRRTLTVSVTPEHKAFAGRSATNRYVNAIEVVSAALRLMKRDEPAYRAAWRKPDQGGAADR